MSDDKSNASSTSPAAWLAESVSEGPRGPVPSSPVLEALILSQIALRRWTELYAKLQNESGEVVSRKLDYNLPPSEHVQALEAVAAALEHVKSLPSTARPPERGIGLPRGWSLRREGDGIEVSHEQEGSVFVREDTSRSIAECILFYLADDLMDPAMPRRYLSSSTGASTPERDAALAWCEQLLANLHLEYGERLRLQGIRDYVLADAGALSPARRDRWREHD